MGISKAQLTFWFTSWLFPRLFIGRPRFCALTQWLSWVDQKLPICVRWYPLRNLHRDTIIRARNIFMETPVEHKGGETRRRQGGESDVSGSGGRRGAGSHLIKEREKGGLGGKTFWVPHSCKGACQANGDSPSQSWLVEDSAIAGISCSRTSTLLSH